MDANRPNINQRLKNRAKRDAYKIKQLVEEAIQNRRYMLMIDSPVSSYIKSNKIIFEGWLIPKGSRKVKSIRIVNGTNKYPVKYGIKRDDVMRSLPSLPNTITLNSGFFVELSALEGHTVIQVDFGKGYKNIYSLELKNAEEASVASVFNPRLSENMAEHENLIQNRYSYDYEESQSFSFNRHQDDPRLVALYLPQFHPIQQNNEVWGEGFTEWTNVTQARPRFIGHRQPILPRDLGFYDLRQSSVIKKQIDLAKKHGLYGFSFYYYWFSGEKILDTPINTFLENKDWDFNFSICWANENWTKRWDGRDNDIIIAQKYLDDDPLNFIKDIEHILTDNRYIREEGKPILTVYRASDLKNPKEYARVWRKYMMDKYKLELKLVSVISFDCNDPREYDFDASLDFAPLSNFFKNDIFETNKLPYISVDEKLLDINFSGSVIDYRKIALNKDLYTTFDFPTYKCVMPSWDNDARKKGKGFVFQNSHPDIYAKWLDSVISLEKNKIKSPVIYINAWNEWAEGAVLEPTLHQGSAVLNRTTEVLARHSQNKDNFIKLQQNAIMKTSDLAVVVHLYYTEVWAEIGKKLNNIEQDFDLFISMNIKDSHFRDVIKKEYPNANIYIVPNRGRDVLPFINILRKLDNVGYKYVLKLHSKKSKHRKDGGEWFKELTDNLLHNKDTVSKVIQNLEANSGIIGPRGHYVSTKKYIGSNKKNMVKVLSMIYDSKNAIVIAKKQINKSGYFAGTMFWASIESLRPLLDIYLLPDDFEPERGQIDGTMAHAIERIFGLLMTVEKNNIYIISGSSIEKCDINDSKKEYNYV